MLSVPQAARKAGRDPETVRRWIRAGKLPAQKIGTQHMIDEADFTLFLEGDFRHDLPQAWLRTWTGEPQLDWATVVRRSRQEH